MKKKEAVIRRYQCHIEELQRAIRQIKNYERLYVGGEVVSFFCAVGAIYLYATHPSKGLYLLFCGLFFVIYFAVRFSDVRNTRRKNRMNSLLAAYRREIDYQSGIFCNSAESSGEEFVNASHPYTFDLDIFGRNSLFHRMNRTVTAAGKKQLAEYLQSTSIPDLQAVGMRTATLRALSQDEMMEQRIAFMAVGTEGKIDTSLIAQNVKDLCQLSLPQWVMSRSFLVSFSLSLLIEIALLAGSAFGNVSGLIPFYWSLLQLCVTSVVCSRALKNVSAKLEGLCRSAHNLATLIKLSQSFKPDSSQELSECMESMALFGKAFDQFYKLASAVEKRGNLLSLLLCNALFMNDILLLRNIMRWRADVECKFGDWLSVIGRFDAWISMSQYRYNEPATREASFADTKNIVCRAKNMRHPFLGEKAVPNDFNIEDKQFYIITGANMAGKSTFLRTLGINYVLAMNGLPVFADNFLVSRFGLFTGMRATDDLTKGISYFNAELIRLRQLLEYCRSHRPTLIILDEILRGTNSLDKLNGSKLFLQYVSKMDVSGVVATHDLELSHMAEDFPRIFHNYCFEIELDKNVKYSYRIAPGIARNQNATYLLKSILVDDGQNE